MKAIAKTIIFLVAVSAIPLWIVYGAYEGIVELKDRAIDAFSEIDAEFNRKK